MEPSTKPRGTYADYLSGNYSNKHFVFELTKKNGPGSLMFSKETNKVVEFPISYNLPLVGTVYLKDAKGVVYPKRIRYVVGENSIFVDEQTPDDKYPKKMVYASFIKGRFQVDGKESVLLKYLFTCDSCETKKDRDSKKPALFRLVDKSAIAKKQNEELKLEFDVLEWCDKADFTTKILPLAKLIFREEQLLQSASEIRFDMKVLARRNPKSFKAILDDPKTERGIVVNAAIERGVIYVAPESNSLHWTNNPSDVISVAPEGSKVVQDFISKSFTSKGESVYNNIKRHLDMMEEPQEDLVPALTDVINDPMAIEMMVTDAFDKGIIKANQTKAWWYYKDLKISGRKQLVQEFMDKPELLKQLREDLMLPPEE